MEPAAAESSTAQIPTLRQEAWKLLSALIHIPFLGKGAIILLFFPWIVLPFYAVFATPFEKEAETAGRYLTVFSTTGLERKIEYEYMVDGEHYTGTRQWVDMKLNPQIRTGAPLKVYYSPKAPALSHAEGEATHTEMFFIMLGANVGLWAVLFGVAYYRLKGRAKG